MSGVTMTTPMPSLLRTRTSVALAFALNGLLFATLVSRFPDVRSDLGLSNSALGLLMISASIGSVLSLPLSGRVIERFTPALTVKGGSIAVGSGLLVAGIGATVVEQPLLAAVGLFAFGVGTSMWDVAMNVEGAEVERRLGRTIMPRFHAAWSVGSIIGSGIGILMAALDVPVVLHYLVLAVVAVAL